MAATSITTCQLSASVRSAYRSSTRSIPCKSHFIRGCNLGNVGSTKLFREMEKQPRPYEQTATPVAPPQPAVQTPPPPQKPKVSTKFSDVLAFGGPAPERINGRLAMIGFAAAIGAELARGDDLAAQLANGAFPWFVATAIIFSAASLVPLFKGVTVQSKSDGLMTADAEMWNGRFAMLGLVALAFTEYVKGGPLV